MTNSDTSGGAFSGLNPSGGGASSTSTSFSSNSAASTNPYAAPEDLQVGDVMLHEKIHPVMLFGGPATGKSVLIASLLAYGMENSDAGMDVALGEPIHDTKTSTGLGAANLAQAFFETKFEAWLHRENIPSNQGGAYFVPVDVTIRQTNDQLKMKKFAFLDWEGEKQRPNAPQNVDPFVAPHAPIQSRAKPIDPLGQSILSHFTNGISVMFLAPVFDSGDIQSRHREHGLTLVGGMDQYKRHRSSRIDKDRHIFLMSQWDRLYPPGSPEFVAPPESVLESCLQSRYGSAWSKFQLLPCKPDQLAKMQYSSGEHDVNSRRMKYQHDDPKRLQVARYARTLWNWLFINATGSAIFSDVMLPQPQPTPQPSPAPQRPRTPPSPTPLEQWIHRLNSY